MSQGRIKIDLYKVKDCFPTETVGITADDYLLTKRLSVSEPDSSDIYPTKNWAGEQPSCIIVSCSLDNLVYH